VIVGNGFNWFTIQPKCVSCGSGKKTAGSLEAAHIMTLSKERS